MEININDIKRLVTSTIYSRGFSYYKQDRVKLQSVELDRFEAIVYGSEIYHVMVEKKNDAYSVDCDCPYWTVCKHIVAALLAARDYYKDHHQELLQKKATPQWSKFFQSIFDQRDRSYSPRYSGSEWQILYTFELSHSSWSITPKRALIKKDGSFGRLSNAYDIDYNTHDLNYATNDPLIMSYLKGFDSYTSGYRSYYYYYPFNHATHQFPFGDRKTGVIFDLLRDSLIYLSKNGQLLEKVAFATSPAKIDYQFQKQEEAYQLQSHLLIEGKIENLDHHYKILTANPMWILKQNVLIKVDNFVAADLLIPFTASPINLTIPKSELPQFIETVYPRLQLATPIPLPDDCEVQTIAEISQKRVYLKEGTNRLRLYLSFRYRDIEVYYHDPRNEFYKQADGELKFYRVERNFEVEEEIHQQLLTTGLRVDKEGIMYLQDTRAINWIFSHIPQLTEQGFEFYGQEKLNQFKVRASRPRINLSITSGIDWFDLNVEIDFDGLMLSLKELKKAIEYNQKIIKLTDGSLAKLPDDWFKNFVHLFGFGNIEDKKLRLSRFHIPLIDILLAQANSKQTDEPYRESLIKLRNFEGIQYQKLPTKINGVLRSYQKEGYNWLYFLKDFSFGGCLADDMGLGKTLQALTLLLNEKEKGINTPSLIVCPTSVVFNWENEVKKFTPDLTVLKHVGIDRHRTTEPFKNYDLIVTSYGIMQRDFVFLKDFNFHYVILDESQKIKNPATHTSKAVRLLKANHRLVMTGTPIENNTIELWSQFAFLNPGLLGSLNFFRKNFATPIEKRSDEDTAQRLRKMVFPFILRRTKEHVAKELPPKIEQIYYCSMNKAQQKLYNQWRDYFRAVILNKIDQVGLDKSRFNVLQGLVKLRQIACHPNLVDITIWEDSGKFESLKEILEEVLAENHKVLLFSQFVKMLRLIRKYLDKEKIPYEYLDGHTTNREECVTRFQTDDQIPIFLISLKAGGTGINLTAADYVIHYDPWWNPAVETQATDRTHRIGQDKKVFVYKLITKDSVEEKILDLQKKKGELVSNIITTDSSFFKSLSRADIEILFS